MTVESTLQALLSPLVGGRAYPDVAPEGAARPYITYQQVGGRSLTYTEGVLPTTKNGRFQVSVWSGSRQATSGVSLQAEAALVASTTLQVEPLGAFTAVHEPDTGLYGALQDFSVWSPR